MRRIIYNGRYPFCDLIDLISEQRSDIDVKELVCNELNIDEEKYNELLNYNTDISESGLSWKQIKALCKLLSRGFDDVFNFDTSNLSDSFIKCCIFKMKNEGDIILFSDLINFIAIKKDIDDIQSIFEEAGIDLKTGNDLYNFRAKIRDNRLNAEQIRNLCELSDVTIEKVLGENIKSEFSNEMIDLILKKYGANQLSDKDLQKMNLFEDSQLGNKTNSKSREKITGVSTNSTNRKMLFGLGAFTFFACIAAWFIYGKTPDYIKAEEGLTHIAVAADDAKGTLENGEQIDIGGEVLSYKLFSENRRVFGGRDGIAYAKYHNEVSDKDQYIAVNLDDFHCNYTFEDEFLDNIECVAGIRKGIDYSNMITDEGYEITIDSNDMFFSSLPNSEGQVDVLVVGGNRIHTGKIDSSQIMYFTDQIGPTEYVDVKLVPNKKDTRTGNNARSGRDIAILNKIESGNSSGIYERQ